MNTRRITILTAFTAIFALIISSCQPTATETNTESAPAGSGQIAFIRLDTLTNQYDALQAMQSEMEGRFAEMDKSQNERIAAFQRDLQSFQRRANSGTMAPKQIGTEQERLAGREQALMQEAERLRQELQVAQLTMMGEYEENLKKVLDEIQEEFNYDYILSHGVAGGSVLMANDSYDITSEVSKRLNLIPMDGKSDEEEAESTEAEEATEEE